MAATAPSAQQSAGTRLAANAMFLCVLFPYISPVPTPYDVQPYSLILAIILTPAVLLSKRRAFLPGPLAVLLLLVFAAILFSLVNFGGFFALRSMAGYLSVFLISLVAYKTFPQISHRLYLIAITLWLTACPRIAVFPMPPAPATRVAEPFAARYPAAWIIVNPMGTINSCM